MNITRVVYGKITPHKENIPTPRVLMAFDADAAIEASDAMGYPCVLKPVIGSWGRLLARVDSHK